MAIGRHCFSLKADAVAKTGGQIKRIRTRQKAESGRNMSSLLLLSTCQETATQRPDWEANVNNCYKEGTSVKDSPFTWGSPLDLGHGCVHIMWGLVNGMWSYQGSGLGLKGLLWS